ncbi:hypothetical protein [Phormidium sp. FACHB-1136]|jgi:hypothetical protein|uniref:hypothetical protein n=1 Tax=Phormidium sp. FACHB-1136 TaxID=2692848 RepID=UPI0016898B0D|nr:hypothetical protein [Phormidium sp. FACHB-1136]MBD2425308.1 hypothetical protein [Phormidium sp. FACHB-1136]
MMVTNAFDSAVQLSDSPRSTVERYTRLCRAYVQLSERFHQLDVDHMTLKGQVIPLLKALKAQQDRLRQLQMEKESLQQSLDQQSAQHHQEMQTLTQTYEDRLGHLTRHLEELRPLEGLLSSDLSHELAEAESQMDLVDATLQEMGEDDEPDLTADEKALLAAYRANPSAFLVVP